MSINMEDSEKEEETMMAENERPVRRRPQLEHFETENFIGTSTRAGVRRSLDSILIMVYPNILIPVRLLSKPTLDIPVEHFFRCHFSQILLHIFLNCDNCTF